MADDLERKNTDLMKAHLRELKHDREARQKDAAQHIAQAVKQGVGLVHHRARGRRFIVLG